MLSFTSMMSETLKKIFFILLLVPLSASVQQNAANVKLTCSDSTMHVRMNFRRPFKGIVFTPDNYFNETCSYASSPTSTNGRVTLKLPVGSCGTKVYKSGNNYFASVSLIVEQHRMLDSVSDYVHNISCELPNVKRTSVSSESESSKIPQLHSWITFQLGLDLFPEEVVEATDIGHELFLTYHVLDSGVHKDIKVMNCIGHDDLIIDRKTRIYQLSDPFGCPSDKDALSAFSVIRNWRGVSNLLAYAVVRNVSMVTRGRFYITCGAQLCKETCQTKCDEINRQVDPLYFSDMATKGMVNRAPDSQIPLSLSMFERGGRIRRADNRSEESIYNETESLRKYLESKVEELHEFVSLPINSSTSEYLLDSNSTSVTEDLITYQPVTLELSRRKRRVKLERSDMFPKMRVLFIPDSPKVLYPTYETAVLINLTDTFGQDNYSNSSVKAPVVLTQVNSTKQLKVKPCNDEKMCGFNSPMFSSDRYVLNCALRTIVAVFALLCFSGACYSLFFIKRDSNDSRTAPMTYSY